MSVCDDYIEKISKTLPEQCRIQDLVDRGIFKSVQTEFHARSRGDVPSYFKIGRRVIYLREAVIEWLKEKKHESGEQSADYIAKQRSAEVSECEGVAHCSG